jgi:uncharacterized protein (DUF1501 family)
VNEISRRRFITGSSATLASLLGAGLLDGVAPASAAGIGRDLLVMVFLRGGWDALSVATPLAGVDRVYYEAARPTLQIAPDRLLPLDVRFGLHPALAPLYPLYEAGKLALIHAAGLATDTRSHFDAQTFIELGTPGRKTAGRGWLTRHLTSAPDRPPETLLPAVALGSELPTSLLGSDEAAVIPSLATYALNGKSSYRGAQHVALREMYGADHWLYRAGTTALDAVEVVSYLGPGAYRPAEGVVYPASSFAKQLQTLAQVAKLPTGLEVATVDLGGWDFHDTQGGDSKGRLTDLLTTLAQGLAAFYQDMAGIGLTIVVQSEFGRRLRENASGGFDHGHGGTMLVLGEAVNGGLVYGDWPGLHNDQLYDKADLEVTTDYRLVLAEILERRLANPNLDEVFPGLVQQAPLNLVQEG